jgi:hypothetical protein
MFGEGSGELEMGGSRAFFFPADGSVVGVEYSMGGAGVA